MKKGEEYYCGYLAAIQDVARNLKEEAWVEATVTLDELTKGAVRDIDREGRTESD